MSNQVDTGRRQFLTVATIATGAVGAAFAAVPFLASWKPSARAKALGAPVEVDISKVDPGAMIKVEWRGKAVYIVHRTPQMLTQLEGMAPKLRDPDSKQSEQPDFARNPARAKCGRHGIAGAACRLRYTTSRNSASRYCSGADCTCGPDPAAAHAPWTHSRRRRRHDVGHGLPRKHSPRR